MDKKVLCKNIFHYVIIFCFLLFVSVYTTSFSNDEVWNFGFAKNLFDGLVPYRDFNMIVTPFYPFIMSLPFYLFGDHLIVTIIFNLLLLIGSFILLQKLIGNHSWLFVLVLVFPLSIIFPCYNLFLFYMLVLLIYLETKVEKNDIWIGLLLGFFILTKQTIGLIILFTSILLWRKDLKRLCKRLLFCFLPIFLFVIYLLVHHAFNDFIDQCFLGMFDFGQKNTLIPILWVLVCVFFIGEAIYFIRKNPERKENYYILAYYSVMIPIFNMAHAQIAFLGFIVIHFLNCDISKKISKCLTIFSVFVAVISQFVIFYYLPKPVVLQKNVSHFEYRLIYEEDIDYLDQLKSFYQEHPDDSIIILSRETYFVKIALDQRIGKLDLINYGNHGYHGTDKLIQLVQDHKDAYFLTYKEDICSHSQTDCDVIAYVADHFEKVDELGVYAVYKNMKE